MNYDLADELRKAGFPQGEELYCRCAFLTHEQKEAGGAEEVYDCNTERVYKPTLEELIEACGKDFQRIQYYPNAENETNQWGAFPRIGEGELLGIGSTPKEAVARLYLALNRGPHTG